MVLLTSIASLLLVVRVVRAFQKHTEGPPKTSAMVFAVLQQITTGKLSAA